MPWEPTFPGVLPSLRGLVEQPKMYLLPSCVWSSGIERSRVRDSVVKPLGLWLS